MNGLVPTTRIDSPTRGGSPALVSTDSPSINAIAACSVLRRAIGGMSGFRVMKNT